MQIPFFNQKPQYRAPQVPPVPARKEGEETGVYVNESERCFLVRIYDTGSPHDIALALGTLRIAEDVVKQTLSSWHTREARRSAILRPSNGN